MNKTLVYTVIHHQARIDLGLTIEEYCIADVIHHLSANPSGNNPGWCYMTKETMAENLGVGRATVFRAIKKLIEKGLIEKHPTTKGLVRSTSLWYETTTLKKDSSQNETDRLKMRLSPSQNETDRLKMRLSPSQNETVDRLKMRLNKNIDKKKERNTPPISPPKGGNVSQKTKNFPTNRKKDSNPQDALMKEHTPEEKPTNTQTKKSGESMLPEEKHASLDGDIFLEDPRSKAWLEQKKKRREQQNSVRKFSSWKETKNPALPIRPVDFTPLSDVELWEIAKELSVPPFVPEEKQKEILERVADGSWNPSWGRTLSFAIKNFIRNDKRLGRIEELDELGKIQLMLDHPEEKRRWLALCEKRKNEWNL